MVATSQGPAGRVTAGSFRKVAGAIGSFGRHMYGYLCTPVLELPQEFRFSGFSSSCSVTEATPIETFTGGSECPSQGDEEGPPGTGAVSSPHVNRSCLAMRPSGAMKLMLITNGSLMSAQRVSSRSSRLDRLLVIIFVIPPPSKSSGGHWVPPALLRQRAVGCIFRGKPNSIPGQVEQDFGLKPNTFWPTPECCSACPGMFSTGSGAGHQRRVRALPVGRIHCPRGESPCARSKKFYD